MVQAPAAPPPPLQASETGFGDQFLRLTQLKRGAFRWDTFRVNAGTMPDQVDLFRVPRGKIGSGFPYKKSVSETNLRNPNILEISVDAMVEEIRVSLLPWGQQATSPDMQEFLNRVIEEHYLEFRVNRAEQIGGRPLMMFDDIGQITGEPAMGGAVPEAYGSQWGSARSAHLLIGIPIPARSLIGCRIFRNINASDIATVPEGFEFLYRVELRGKFNEILTQ